MFQISPLQLIEETKNVGDLKNEIDLYGFSEIWYLY